MVHDFSKYKVGDRLVITVFNRERTKREVYLSEITHPNAMLAETQGWTWSRGSDKDLKTGKILLIKAALIDECRWEDFEFNEDTKTHWNFNRISYKDDLLEIEKYEHYKQKKALNKETKELFE